MNGSPVLEWLSADFEQGLQRYHRNSAAGPPTGNGTARPPSGR